MKKKMTSILLILLMLFCTGLTTANAEKAKNANPPKKIQGEIAPDSDNYIIGPEDVLLIYVWHEESLTKTVPVRMDGKISLPLVDDIQAAEHTPLQLKNILTNKLKNYVDNPTVTVTVLEANSFKAYITGEVKQPGVLRLRSETTLVKLIIMSGGFTQWANQKKIIIITKDNKGAEKRIYANYNKIIDGKDADVVIRRGDTVIVN